MGEAQYLLEQRIRAKAGLRMALGNVKRDAVKACDPRPWAKIHPWATMAAAFAAGFVAAEAIPLSSPREEKERPSPAGGTLHGILSLARRIVSLAVPVIRAILAAEAAAESDMHHPSNGRHHASEADRGL
jgi:hypothetical protein